jgi:methionine sulfoxide reductase heme-binding subunit
LFYRFLIVKMPTAFIQRWHIVACSTLMVSLAVGAIALLYGLTETGLRIAIRFTARSSCVLFLLAFVGSSLAALWPSAITQWLRANRRYFGLSFAASHVWHAIAIIGLAFFSQGKAISYSPGGMLGYVFIVLMAATSNNGAMQWLGDRRWQILHLVGAYYLWIAFFVSFSKRWTVSFIYPSLTVLLVVAMGLRIFNLIDRRRLSRTS